MSHRVALCLALALAAIGLALGGGSSVAAPTGVSLGSCDASPSRTAIVAAGADVGLAGPTFLGKNRGAIEDFLTGTTTTFSLNGVASTAGTFSAPAAVNDPVYGAVWATTWAANVPGPVLGAPVRVRLAVTLQHVMPQLLAPASDGNAGYGAGAVFSRACLLDASQPVGSGGGTVTTADHAVTLTVPAGALATTVPITVDPSTATPPSSIGSAVGTSFDLGPSGTQFQTPVTVALTFDPTAVPAGPGGLHLAGLSNGVWRLLPSTVNATTHTVSAQVRHFSAYAVVKAACTGFVVGGVVTDGIAAVTGVQAQEINGSISAPVATDLTDVNGEYALCVADGTTINLRYEPPIGSAYASQWYSGATTLGAATAVTIAGADVRADVVLGPGTPITGVLTDRSTGLPLANAFVTIHQVTPTGFCCQFPTTVVERTMTDATGRYHAALPAATYKLVAFPPSGGDYVNQWWRDALGPGGATALVVPSADSAADVSFALAPGVRISGQVTDPAGGPLSGAGVTAFVPDANGNPSPVVGSGTNTSGSYSFVVPPGTYRIQFSPPQGSLFLRQWWNNQSSFATADPLTVSLSQPAPAGGVNAALAQGYRVSGTVRDAVTGAAIGGGNVGAFLPLAPGACCKPQNVGGTNVAADGTFSFAVPAGTYIFNANGPQSGTYVNAWYGDGRDPHLATQITVDATTPNAATGLAFALQPGFVISGTVRDSVSGAPIASANVGASLVPAPGACCVGVGGSNTQADGTFRFIVPAGTYILNMNAPQGSSYISSWYGGSTPDTATPITVNATSPNAGTGLSLSLQLGFRITGHVTTPTGAPAPQIGIHAPGPSADNGCGGGCGMTNANGDFDFAILPGIWKISFDPQPSNQNLGTLFVRQYWNGAATFDAATVITATAGGSLTGLNAQLQAGYLVSGTVRDAGSGAPIANANMNVQLEPVPGYCCAGVAGTRTQTDGSFRIVVPAGTYILFAGGPLGSNYVSAWYGGTDLAQAIRVTLGPSSPNAGTALSLSLQLGFRITGHVTTPTGAPAPQIGVHAPDATTENGCGGGCGITNSNGDFDFAILPGTWKIRFDPQPSNQNLGTLFVRQYWNGASSFDAATVITATAGGSLTGLNAQLQAGYLVSGTVRDAGSGAPIANANIGVNLAPAPGGCCVGVGGTNTQADGTFRIVVPAGTYILYVGAPRGSSYISTWYGGSTPDVATAIAVGPTTPNAGTGLAITLATGYRISGTLRDATTGAPVANAYVEADLQPAPGTCCTSAGGANTDPNGAFDFAVPAGTYILRLNPPQGSIYVWSWYGGVTDPSQATTIVVGPTAPNAGTGLTPTLIQGLLMSGVVHDAGGAPVAGAGVELNQGPLSGFGYYSTRSLADGTWSVRVAPGSYVLYVSGPSTGPALVAQWWPNTMDARAATVITRNGTTATPPDPITVVLQPGFRVSGTVTDPSGAGVAHVGVVAQDATQPCCRDVAAWGSDWVGGGTDAAGRWTLVVPAGSFVFTFYPNCCMPTVSPTATPYLSQYWNGKGTFATADVLAVSATQLPPATGVNVTLTLGYRISGTVTDAATGAPVAAVGIGAQDAGQPCCSWLSGGGTDALGRYSIVVPAGASVKIQFDPRNAAGAFLPQWYNGATSFDTAAVLGGPAGGTVSGIDAHLATGLVISGRVTLPGGAPAANAWIGALPGGANAVCCVPTVFSTGTDATGAYRLVVPAGTYRIQANAPQSVGVLPAFYSTTTPGTGDFYLATDVSAPASGIDIALQAGVHIRGIVTSGGVGIGGVNVAAHRLTASGQCCDSYQGTMTGPDGSYDLVVASGTWRIRFTGPATSHLVGTWYGSPTDFNAATNVVVGSTDIPNINAALSTGIWISGRVLGPDGVTPLANVGVQAQSNASCCVWSPLQVWTDATGSYHLAVPAGATYRVQASPNDQVTLLLWQWYSTTTPGTRDFNQGTDVPVAGTDVGITDMVLRQGYAIRGHVTLGGVPAPFVNVSALNATVPCCVWGGGTRSQADGSYVLVVPIGTYKVSFDAPGHPQVWYGGTDFTSATPLTVPPGLSGVDGAVP